jgi:hypothetical protein
MHVVAAILGLLLLVFGGGCTLIIVVGSIIDLRSMLADIPLLLTIWLPLGLVPGLGGWYLLRWAMRKAAERRTTPLQ